MSARETIGHTKRYIKKFLDELIVHPSMHTGTTDLHVAELVIVNHIVIMAMLRDCTVDIRPWYNSRYPEIPGNVRSIATKVKMTFPGYQDGALNKANAFWAQESSALIRWSMENMSF